MSEEIIVKTLGECFEELISRIKDDDLLKSFRSRARDMPTEIFSKGLTYALILSASRGDLNTLQKTLIMEKCSDIIDASSKLEREAFGYTLYASILLYVLRNMGEKLGATFKEVLQNTVNNYIVAKKAFLVADWIKRFSEAYIKTKG